MQHALPSPDDDDLEDGNTAPKPAGTASERSAWVGSIDTKGVGHAIRGHTALLGIVSAYFAAVVVLIAGLGKAGHELATFLNVSPTVAWIITILPLVGIFLVDAKPRLHKHAADRRLLRLSGELPRHFFRVRAYTNSDYDRDLYRHISKQEGKSFCDWVIRQREPVLYLVGPSGCGKTSLLQSSLLPTYSDFQVGSYVALTLSAEMKRDLTSKITQLLGDRADSPTDVWKLLGQAIADNRLGRLMIVVDQLEGLAKHSSVAQKADPFLDYLIRFVQQESSERVQLLLTITDEHKSDLPSYFPAISSSSNCWVMENLPVSDAHGILERSGLEIADGLKAAIFQDIGTIQGEDETVSPVLLNMAGVVLVRRAVEGEGKLLPYWRTIGLIKDYIYYALRRTAHLDSDGAVLSELAGKKSDSPICHVTDLAKTAKLSNAVVREVLDTLKHYGLARPIAAHSQFWQISHPFLIQPIADATGNRFHNTIKFLKAPLLLIPSIAVLCAFAGAVARPLPKTTPPWWMVGDPNDVVEQAGGETKLHYAVVLKDHAAVDYLISHGADVNYATHERHLTPLMRAAKEGNVGMVRKLLDSGANISKDWQGETALHLAAWYGRPEVAKVLLSRGAAVDAEKIQHPPEPPIGSDLLRRWVKPRASKVSKFTPLHFAAMGNHLEVVKVLLEGPRAKANVEARSGENDREVGTPIMYAALRGGYDVVQYLLEQGARPEAKMHGTGESVLHFAAMTDDDRLVALLVKKGAKVDERNTLGQTPLTYAAWKGQPRALTSLLQHGASVKHLDNEGNTPLHKSCSTGMFNTTAILVNNLNEYSDAKDWLNKANHGGVRPIHYAAASGGADLIALLAFNGADLTLQDNRKRDPKGWAEANENNKAADAIAEWLRGIKHPYR